MPTTENFSFKRLLARLPRGEPLTSKRLAAEGLSASHASRLVQLGWLTRLGRGAYMLPGDTLTRDGCLAHLALVVPGLHVGGKTALAWRGVRHNLAVTETVELWGSRPVRLPGWLTSRFPCRYQVTRIFDDMLPGSCGLSSLPNGRQEVLVSTPERALLELLSDAGKAQSVEETRNLVESTRGLRESVLGELLAHTVRIKVVRMARQLSQELALPWAPLAEEHNIRLGGGKRWISHSRKTGERLVLKRK